MNNLLPESVFLGEMNPPSGLVAGNDEGCAVKMFINQVTASIRSRL